MSDSKQRIADIEAPDAEVELSTADLLELAAPCDNNERASTPLKPSQTATIVVAAPVASRRHKPASRMYLSLVVAMGAVGVLYLAMSPREQAQSVQLPQSKLPLQVEREPVRFANPFDANEVFEFPAGTTEAAAREAVAEILMERAMQRQRQFDARVSNNG